VPADPPHPALGGQMPGPAPSPEGPKASGGSSAPEVGLPPRLPVYVPTLRVHLQLISEGSG